MSLTRKDFEAIAKMIRDNTILVGGEAKGEILKEDFVRYMASYLQEQNPIFDKERFIKACYEGI